MKQKTIDILKIIFFIVGIILICMAFYKLLFYLNPEDSYYENSINAYVGGDAYNIIINAIYFSGYLISGTLFEFMGVFLGVKSNELKKDEDLKNEN